MKKKLTVLTATLIALAEVAPGSLTNPSFESPDIPASPGYVWNQMASNWTVTVTAANRPRYGQMDNSFLALYSFASQDGSQVIYIDSLVGSGGAAGDTVAISQQITGYAIGKNLRGSIWLTPFAGGYDDDFVATYGFFSDAGLTTALGTTISTDMNGKADNTWTNYGTATYDVAGGEPAIYFGLKVVTGVDGVRSWLALDNASVIIPEPASALLLGLAGLCLLRRRARG